MRSKYFEADERILFQRNENHHIQKRKKSKFQRSDDIRKKDR